VLKDFNECQFSLLENNTNHEIQVEKRLFPDNKKDWTKEYEQDQTNIYIIRKSRKRKNIKKSYGVTDRNCPPININYIQKTNSESNENK
jgi:hypothetical protein